MLRSLYSGVSGMKSNQVKMDVIGNNIANVNTTAFKASRVKFQETLSNTMSTALGPDITGKGAKNPKQVGMGTTVSSIDTMMTDGVHEPTGRELDFAIERDGFFVVSSDIGNDNTAPGQVSFTRDGCFYRDSQGTLVNSSGNKVMGYPADTQYTSNQAAIDAIAARDAYSTLKDIDQNGTPAFADVNTAITKAKAIATTIDTNATGGGADDIKANDALTALNGIAALDGASTPADITSAITIAEAAASDIYDVAKALSDADPITDSSQKIQASEYVNMRTLEIPTSFVKDDITGELLKDSATGAYLSEKGVGQSVITLDTFNVDASGQITAICSDQNSYKIGRLAVAKFKNQEGLTKQGSNSYGKTANSGEPEYGKAGENSFGTITQGALEVSNVDLANQFTDMIITSRAYQANSRSITTSDEMLQELLNLKR